MSISPKQKEESKIKLSLASKTFHSTRNVITKFFEKPTYYLFYLTMVATTIGLLFGNKFPIELYLFLIILGITQIYEAFNKTY